MIYGLRIKSATSGWLMALRKSAEQVSGEDAYIQGVDIVTQQLSLVQLRSGVTAIDSYDISDPTSGLGTGITMNDRQHIVVQPIHSIDTGICRLTPICLCGSDIKIGETLESGMGVATFYSGSDYYSPELCWDVRGAETVYIHVTHINVGGVNSLDIMGGAI